MVNWKSAIREQDSLFFSGSVYESIGRKGTVVGSRFGACRSVMLAQRLMGGELMVEQLMGGPLFVGLKPGTGRERGEGGSSWRENRSLVEEEEKSSGVDVTRVGRSE